MIGLEERLAHLRPEIAGDWDDVVSRARGLDAVLSRRHRRRVALVLAALALVVGAGTALAIGHGVFGWFEVSRSDRDVPPLAAADVPYVFGRVLYEPGKPPQRLSRPLLASLLGQTSALAVSSPDRRYVVYHSWRRGVPLLVVHDVHTGRDRLLARGAQTFAWSTDGRLAYWQATHARYRPGKFVGNVVVRRGLRGAPETWTTRAGGYEVIAWARGRLLVGVRRCYFPSCRRDPTPGVYELEPSGRLRPLPFAGVSALSPDGRLAIGPYLPVPGQDSPSSLIRLVDVTRRRALTTFDLAQAARAKGLDPRPFATGIQQAAWRGDEIVATSSAGNGSVLVFLRVVGERLQLDDVLRVPRSTLRVRYGPFFGVPAFAGRGTGRVTVPISGDRGNQSYSAALLTCDRGSRRCVRGRLVSPRRWFVVVTNQSRP